jgi:hypothetical protein
VPDGVKVLATTRESGSSQTDSSSLRLMQTHAMTRTHPFSVPSPINGATCQGVSLGKLEVRGGYAVGVWEWIKTPSDSGQAPHFVDIDIVLVAEPNTVRSGATAYCQGSFAPLIDPEDVARSEDAVAPAFGIAQAYFRLFSVD